MDEDFERLTPRHQHVLGLVAGGQSNKEIANALGLRQGTVKSYVEEILLILGVPNRAAAGARWAAERARHESEHPDVQPTTAPAE